MQTHTKLRDRLLSFILVLVMIVGLIPMGIVDAQAAGTYQNVTDAIKGNGGSITLNVNLLNSYGTADNIVSSHGNVAQYLGQYSGYGLSGFGYCANHSGRATNGMSVTVTEAHRVKSPVVINTYFSGYTDENRDEEYFKKYLVEYANDIGYTQRAFYADTSFDGLTNLEWRKATQMALWMALQTTTGVPMLSIDRQKALKNGQIVSDYKSNALDTVSTPDGGQNYNSMSKRRIIQAAIILHLRATELVDKQLSMGQRVPGSSSRPVEYDDLKASNFYPESAVVDFTFAKEDGTGNIADAYDRYVADTGDENVIYKQTIDGKDYYVIYWMFNSKTQASGWADVTLSGTYPDGTKIMPLTEELDAAFAEEYGLYDNADLNSSGKPSYLWYFDENGHRVNEGTGEDEFAQVPTVPPIGGLIEDVDTNAAQPGGESYLTLFKVCIPVDGVQPGDGSSANILINLKNDNVYKYDCYQASNNAGQGWQPFIIGDVMTHIENSGIIKWGEPLVPEDGSYFTVYKKATGGKVLSGAEFTASCNQYSYSMTETTDSTGAATFEIPPQYVKDSSGRFTTWTVTETKAPSGYDLTDQEIQVTAKEGDSGTYTMNDNETTPQTPNSVVMKLDAETGEGLAGAQFKFTSLKGGGGTFTTDSLGQILMQWTDPDAANYINPGTYMVEEILPPDGYNLDSENPVQQIELIYDGEDAYSNPSHLIFNDTKKPSIIINKTDVNGNPLDGAIFEVYKDGALIDTTEATAEGVIEYFGPDGKGLENGYYEFKEITAPDGFMISTEVKGLDVDIHNLNIHSVAGRLTFVDYKTPTIQILKQGANGEGGLMGAQFEVTIDGQVLGTYTTNDQGIIAISEEVYGKYLDEGKDSWTIKVEEIAAPPGYVLPEDPVQEAELKRGETLKSFTFVDDKYPEIKIKKVDAETGEPLAGAGFRIMIDGEVFRDNVLTDQNGEITIDYETFKNFLDDSKDSWTISVEEVTPPDGYLLPIDRIQEQELHKGESLEPFTFRDTKYPYIEIKKVDAETGKPLAGAHFNVEIDGHQLAGPFISDENGMIRIDYEQYKHFLGEETDPDKTWTITVTEITAPEDYNRDPVDTNGWTMTASLTMGEQLPPFIFDDTSYRDIKVTKKDADNGWLLAGAEYVLHCVSLEDPDLEIPADRVGTTDNSGSYTFVDVPNGVYQITEKTPPYGYQGTDKVVTVTVSSDDEPVIEIEYENEPLTGLVIRKVDSVAHQPIANVEFKVEGHTNDGETVVYDQLFTDANGLIILENIKPGQYVITEVSVPDGYVIDTTPRVITVNEEHQSTVYEFENHATNMLYVLKLDNLTGLPVPGVTFSVSTAGGSHIADITTGENGYATLSDLKPGSYVVKEIRVPANMILDPTPQTFEVSADDGGRIYELIFYNNEKTNLLIQKIDAETGEPLEGAYFTIRKGTGEEVATNMRTDENGIILLENQEPGIYILEEVRAPEGYILVEGERRLVLKANSTERVIVENSKKGGMIIEKIDADTELNLPGAVFELYDVQDRLLGTYADRDKDGYIQISDLEPGQYFIKEIKAPDGYILNDELIKVRIDEFKVTTVTVENSQQSLLNIRKVDAVTGVALSGATLQVKSLTGEILFTGTTDDSGLLVVPGLEPGWYIVQETEAPDGYELNNTEYRIEIKEGKVASIEIPNTSKQSFQLRKVDAETMDPLAGAVFEIYTLDDVLVGSYTTDNSGSISTAALSAGHYKIKEVKAPEGYLLDESWQYFEMVEGKSTILTMKNWKRPVIQIQKLDSKTGEPLAGAIFEIRTADNKIVIGQYTTEADGMTYSLPVDPGAYTITEIKAPDGYALNNQPQTVNVEAGHMPEVVRFYNDKQETTIIKKVDSQTGEALAGATFRLYDIEGNSMGEYKTDKDGLVMLPQLDPGSYAIQEIFAPDGYMIDNPCKVTFVVKSGQPTYLTFKDTKKPGLQVIKVDAKTGDPLAGASFELRTATGHVFDVRTTDENGTLIYTDLEAGTYILKEVQAPDGYQMDQEEHMITLEAGHTEVVRVTNTPESALNLKKTDPDGNPLAGAVFTVTRNSDGKVMGRFTTDVTGCLTVEGLEPGEYTVTEVVAPEGYVMTEEAKTVTISNGEPSYVSFVNEKMTGIRIEKYNSATGGVLANAQFTVSDADGKLIGTYTTNTSGFAMTEALAPGRYTVTETKAPTGFAIAEEASQTVEVTAGEVATVRFENAPDGQLEIIKVDAETDGPLSGATFKVTSVSGREIGEFTTDENGRILVTGLEPAYYLVQETKAPAGYTADSQIKFAYVRYSLTSLTVENQKNAGLTIYKVDAKTKEPIAGATFTVTDSNGTQVFTGTTDEAGMVQTEALASGRYTVAETKAPAGYVLNETPQTVTVSTGTTAAVTFENDPEASLTIRKVSALNSEPLAGASFEIRSDDGTIVKYATTDQSGLAFVSGLKTGSYSLTEIKAPEGYILSGDHIDFNVAAGADNSITVENYQNPGLVIRKVDKATGKLLQGATFQVESADGNIAYHGTTDASGIIMTGALPAGTYTVRETSAPEGYLLDSEPQMVELKLNETKTVEFADSPLTSLMIEKVDSLTKETLEGARFKVTNLSDNAFVTEGVTGLDGLVIVDDLTPGQYLVEEVVAPEGYIMDTDPIIATVEMGKVAHVTFFNTPMVGIIIDSVDNDTNDPLDGSTFEIWEQNGEKLYEFTTDNTGRVQTPPLEPGFYVIRQTAVKDGYTILTSEQTVEVVAGNTPVMVTFKAQPSYTLRIENVDENDRNITIADAEFEVSKIDGTIIDTFVTDVNGQIMIPGLEPGWYIVKNTIAGEGYAINEQEFRVEVKAGVIATVLVRSTPLTGLIINVYDSDTHAGLAGATFEVKHQNGNIVGEYTSDKTGHIETDILSEGYYEIYQTKAPDGYLMDTETKTVHLTTHASETVNFYNAPASNLTIKYVDANTGAGVAGAVFEVWEQNGDYVGDFTTEAGGIVSSINLVPGYYEVTLKSAPSGYTFVAETQTVEVRSSTTATAIFRGTANSTLVIQSMTDKNQPLNGSQFEVKTIDGVLIGTYTTDVSGSVTVFDLDAGYYTVTQIEAPDGYQPAEDSQMVTVKAGQMAEATFISKANTGVVIYTTDANGSPVSGVRVEIRVQNGEIVGQYTSDSTGMINVPSMVPGYYDIKILNVPDGYTVASTEQMVQVTTSAEVRLTFDFAAQGNIKIHLTDANTGAAIMGAKFKVEELGGNVIGTYTTDNVGFATSSLLKDGWYVVTQVEPAAGYTLPNEVSRNVQVVSGSAVTVEFENASQSTVQILSVDADGNGIPGMKIAVTKLDGSRVGEYTTDSTGLATMTNVEPGWYVFTETKAPDGYVTNSEAKTVEVKAGAVTRVEITHDRIAGLRIVTLSNQTNQPVANVSYTIEKLNGERVGTYTSDNQGILFVSLAPDTYVVKQTSVANGYEGDTTAQNVTVVANEVTTVEFKVTQMSGMRIHIVDSATGTGIYGMRFLLKQQSGTIVGEYTTDDQGYIRLDKSLVDGWYTLEMIGAPDGYQVDSTPRTIQILNGETTEVNWTFSQEAGQIQVEVRSAEENQMLGLPADSPLSGAVFEIINPENYVVVDTITSGVDGVAASNPLPLGWYTIRQKSASPYFATSDKEMNVKLKVENDVVRVEYLNNSLDISLKHAMQSNQNVSAGSFMRVDFTSVNNESNTNLSDFYWHIKIPTDCARAGTLYTGSWTGRAWYTVSYKTNMKDYKEVSANLLSTNQNNFDLSSTALNLQSGEYVTDIRVNFGEVPAGFKTAIKPALYLYVMPDVSNNYKCIVRSEIGGKISNEWQTATATWTTNVKRLTTLPSELPTTGF